MGLRGKRDWEAVTLAVLARREIGFGGGAKILRKSPRREVLKCSGASMTVAL
jgi:hypothetical protein